MCVFVFVFGRDKRRRGIRKMRGERMIRETQGKEKRERLGQVGGERKRERERERVKEKRKK